MARDVCAFQANKPKASQAKSQEINKRTDTKTKTETKSKTETKKSRKITTARVVSVSNTRRYVIFFTLYLGEMIQVD